MKKNKGTKRIWKYVLLIFGILITLVLISAILFGCFLLHTGPFRYESQEPPVVETQEREMSFLTASGSNIVDNDGNAIRLEGVNLGGWLLPEYWMCPMLEQYDEAQPDEWNALQCYTVLEERFGQRKTHELMARYQDNWITEQDFQRIAAMGCNVIRVPFWYRNFMTDPEGTWITENPDDNPGFQKFDWIIETARKYGLYVIFDMHGCPGGQGTNQCSGSAAMELYTNEAYQQTMEELWTAIAQRYKDEPVIAAYDIMNEPENPDEGAENDQRNEIYDRMIHAIRAVDNRHILAVEAIWSLSVLPEPEETDWENIVYELHCYGNGWDEWTENICQYRDSHQIPIYIGEFMGNSLADIFRDNGLHFTSWTYKGIAWELNGVEISDKNWFMYHEPYCLPAVVSYSPYWLLKLTWGKSIHTEYFTENTKMTGIFQKE